MIKAVIYTRSAEKNDQKIAGQLSLCKAYADKNGMEILAEYSDNGYSGMSAKRPGLKALKANKGWDVLLITQSSVLFRNSVMRARFIDTVTKQGRKIILVESGNELTLDHTRVILQYLGVVQ